MVMKFSKSNTDIFYINNLIEADNNSKITVDNISLGHNRLAIII